MYPSTFLLALMASASAAQLSNTALPSFALVGDDQPAASASTQVPASLSFNPSKAPAFTPSVGAPDFTQPVFPSTPCASQFTPTPIPGVPTSVDLSIGLPVPTPTPAASEPTTTPSTPKEPSSPSSRPAEKPSTTASLPAPQGGFPPYPTGLPVSAGPGFGWGRPRPSGMWPSRGAPRPSGFMGRPRPRPSGASSAGAGPEKGAVSRVAASKPCTLETRVRPTPTSA